MGWRPPDIIKRPASMSDEDWERFAMRELALLEELGRRAGRNSRASGIAAIVCFVVATAMSLLSLYLP